MRPEETSLFEEANRRRHPSRRIGPDGQVPRPFTVSLPDDREQLELDFEGRRVRLTNLHKLFFPDRGLTKRDLLQHYVDVAPWLLPHLADRAMVMRRYPGGFDGPSFFMKRSPAYKPGWVATCAIAHGSGNVIDFPIVQDLPSLLWIVNLGCIDLNPWYARCDDVDTPDALHMDLDPGPGVPFTRVREAALVLHEAFDALGIPDLVKTSGSKGIHVAVPIVRGPNQKDVWAFAKAFAVALTARHPKLLTAEYKVARRPAGRVLVDYNQNAWGRTLASIYSVRPKPLATVSMPVTWDELEQGVEIEDFQLGQIRPRLEALGDLWSAMLSTAHRFELRSFD
jgi:bifunctional non-homologous end joining protein LigD